MATGGCCGKSDPAPAPENPSNRMAKMPDGSFVEVSSRQQERELRQASYAKMRDEARKGWVAVES